MDGDPPAAMRYTEARMAAITAEMFLDIEKETVDYLPNFDSTLKEPVFLPSLLPNLLLMGSEGIAVGMATKIPPHNLGEVVDASNYLIIKSKDYDRTHFFITSAVKVDELLEFIKGPDFPTAGAIYDWTEIKNVYTTGTGKNFNKGKSRNRRHRPGKIAQLLLPNSHIRLTKLCWLPELRSWLKTKKSKGYRI